MSSKDPEFIEQVSVHPKTITAYSRGELEDLPRSRSYPRGEHVRLQTHIKVHPRVWEIAVDLADYETWRIEIISETEVYIHNNGDWRKRDPTIG